MKKRVCRYRCDICRVNFESWDRFNIHSASRAHHIRELQTTQNDEQMIILNEQPTDDVVLCGNGNGLLTPDPVQHIPGAGPEVNFDEDVSYTDDIDEHFSDVDVSECDSGDDDIENDYSTAKQKSAFFPFPSEIFFLLYSFAHNISRPKVISDYLVQCVEHYLSFFMHANSTT